jgi:hypothetical protein
MNKQEFKEMYGAARLLRQAAHAKGVHDTPAENAAWSICHCTINTMHPSVSCAVWGWLGLSAAFFSSRHIGNGINSTKFGAVKCRSRGTS